VLVDGTGLKSASMRSRVASGPLADAGPAAAERENGTPREGVYGDGGIANGRESEREDDELLPCREDVDAERDVGSVSVAAGRENAVDGW
jgi:hypothetical protein